MKRILVLGAGRVARPCVRYLLEHTDFPVVIADRDENMVRGVAADHPRAEAITFDAGSGVGHLLTKIGPDLVINLLPAPFMAPVARACVEHAVNMINVSYAKEEIRALDTPAKEAGILLLCELGLDPGIDHMSAARTIREIHETGGLVESFWSCCGAVPAAEANTNPFGYKLSWSPQGLVGASKREARILRERQPVVFPPGETFRHVELAEIEGLGWFEQYANADSLPYIDLYGIPEARNVYRGTIRYLGWSETIRKMLDLGLFEEETRDFEGMTYRGFTALLAGAEKGEDAKAALCGKLCIDPYSAVMKRLEWLGFLDDAPISPKRGSPRDVVSELYLRKLVFREGERDLVVMEHRFEARLPENRRVRRVSTLVDYGVEGGETAIARTTGLPPAIAARFLLEGGICAKGVHVPVLRDIYDPVLEELARFGIVFRDKEYAVD